MAQKAIVLSEEDAAILQQVINRVKRDTPAARQSVRDEGDYLTPEDYLARAPAGGIPAASGSVLGQAQCLILRSIAGTAEETGLRKEVYNTGPAVPEDAYVHITRDKFGVWFVGSAPSSGTAGALTVTGTAADDSVLFTQANVTVLHFLQATGLDLAPGGSDGSGGYSVVVSTADASPDNRGVVNNDTAAVQSFGGKKGFRDGVELWEPVAGHTSNLEFQVNLGTSLGNWGAGADRTSAYCGLLYTPAGDRTYLRVPGYVNLEPLVELGSAGRVRAGTRFAVGQWEQDAQHLGWVGQDFSMVYKNDADVVRTAEFVGGILVAQYDGLPTTTTPWPTTTGGGTTTGGATTTQGATTTTQPLGVVATATPTSGTTPLAVDFSCSPGGGNPASYSYSWKSTPPGGSIGSTQGFTYTYFNAGTYDVYVTVTDASGNVADSNHLTIQATAPTTTTQGATTTTAPPGPHINSLTPSSAPRAGGTSVSVQGTNFTGVTSVKFGTLNAQSYTVNSATLITASSPSNATAGSFPVTVTTAAGTSNAAAFSFT